MDYLIFAGGIIVIGILVKLGRKDKPDGSGSMRQKQGKQKPWAWRVERKAHKGEQKRQGMKLIWYLISVYTEELYPGDAEDRARAGATKYSNDTGIVTRVVPVYADEEG